ncbi:hypothetical protein [Pseudoflavonifractor phocaeensis]|uniref:hypothetical protein n=1 Tax=Pseudoflavonifractor phocaeensis TaxID=1870988 RepID=UPI00210E708A|nr:hypothetical protein [Pseudoflavonifractor phocaeensis]MCQ4864672.1 hypothetical protein [Pseudoflavonifractor phocaeensis]
MDGSLFSLPLFLTDEVEGAPSLTTIVPQSSDSDEITCVGYGACTLDACPKYCYDVGCPRDCSDCSDCSDSPTYTAPTFTITNITETGADINVSPGTGYTRYRVFARLTSDPDDVSYDWIFDKTIAFTAVMNSLEPKTKYTVNVCGVIGNTSDKWAGAKTFTTGAKNRPGYFSWKRGFVTSKPVANELPRGGDIPPYLTADGWNTYTANINAVREYRGLGQYSFTTAKRGVTRLSAAMVNEAIAAISAMSPPTSPPGRATPMVTPGSASLLNKLVDSLNSIT